MTESAERAERAADFADRRARDASRDARWMVGIALGLAGLLIAGQITLNVQVNAIARDLATLTASLTD